MTDETSDQNWLPSRPPHAVEVRDAQAAADLVGNRGRPPCSPGMDAAADRELLRGLVAAYGGDELRRMIESLA
jgi:hypothetical protein